MLAITGPTGTGKTETSNLIAESLFKRKKKLRNSDKEVSSGLLVFRCVICNRLPAEDAQLLIMRVVYRLCFRGEDFSDNFTNPVTEYHTQIKTRYGFVLLLKVLRVRGSL